MLASEFTGKKDSTVNHRPLILKSEEVKVLEKELALQKYHGLREQKSLVRHPDFEIFEEAEDLCTERTAQASISAVSGAEVRDPEIYSSELGVLCRYSFMSR